MRYPIKLCTVALNQGFRLIYRGLCEITNKNSTENVKNHVIIVGIL